MLPPQTDGRAAQEGLPEIKISPIGNLANRMIQYMAAVKLNRLLGGVPIRGVTLRKWGLFVPADARPAEPDGVYHVTSWEQFDANAIACVVRRGGVRRIVVGADAARVFLKRAIC